MDCISVFAAGFQNVIASSGTAFTELQAKLLSRYSKNVVVNFDPDTAGVVYPQRPAPLSVVREYVYDRLNPKREDRRSSCVCSALYFDRPVVS